MKKLSKNVPLCTAILIIVALLAIPLLGGLKLSMNYRSAEKKFEKALTKPLATTNKDIYADSETILNAARTLLDKGLLLSSASPLVEQRAEDLSKAIEECSSAKTGIAKYFACEHINSACDRYYSAFTKEEQAALERDKSRADDAYYTVKNTYRQHYGSYTQQTSDLISGFPAAQIAKLFGIGGGK